jgi:uncharacterized membrane-anchored protein YhcB (DUF1043 family)
VRLRSPSDLSAARVVVQPYGFWHRPWVRAGAMALGLMLGVLVASWVLSPDAAWPNADSAALKTELETARRELDAARLRGAELAREVDVLAREARRLREELATSQQKSAKRRERRAGVDEEAATRPLSAGAEAPAAEWQVAAPRAE